MIKHGWAAMSSLAHMSAFRRSRCILFLELFQGTCPGHDMAMIQGMVWSLWS